LTPSGASTCGFCADPALFGAVTDAWDSLILRLGLTFAQAVRIRDEVGTGRSFVEPHMRAAAADWTRHRLSPRP
jgi:hypothetical protein